MRKVGLLNSTQHTCMLYFWVQTVFFYLLHNYFYLFFNIGVVWFFFALSLCICACVRTQHEISYRLFNFSRPLQFSFLITAIQRSSDNIFRFFFLIFDCGVKRANKKVMFLVSYLKGMSSCLFLCYENIFVRNRTLYIYHLTRVVLIF